MCSNCGGSTAVVIPSLKWIFISVVEWYYHIGICFFFFFLQFDSIRFEIASHISAFFLSYNIITSVRFVLTHDSLSLCLSSLLDSSPSFFCAYERQMEKESTSERPRIDLKKMIKYFGASRFRMQCSCSRCCCLWLLFDRPSEWKRNGIYLNQTLRNNNQEIHISFERWVRASDSLPLPSVSVICFFVASFFYRSFIFATFCINLNLFVSFCRENQKRWTASNQNICMDVNARAHLYRKL